METRNFSDDLLMSNCPTIRKAWERVIKLKFGEDCEIEWKDSKDIQQGLGTDIIVKDNKGRRFSIELKTRKYNCIDKSKYIMEIVSHVYDKETKPRNKIRTKEGWVYSTTAEYIFHGTLDNKKENIIDCIFYSLVPFKLQKYKSEFDKYENLWLATSFDNGQFQLTLNKLIPKEVIKKDSIDFWEWGNNGI